MAINHGAALKQEIHAEQDKGATRRVAAKAGTEVANTFKDMAQTAGDVVDWGKSIKFWPSSQSSGNASSNSSSDQAQVHQGQERYEQGHQQVGYQQVQQSHQAHAVTRDSVKPVNFDAGNAGNMESRMGGQFIRNHEGAMALNSTAIDAKTTQVQSQGNEVVINPQNNQSKAVNRQVDPKGVKEIGNIAKDTSNIKFGEKQQQ